MVIVSIAPSRQKELSQLLNRMGIHTLERVNWRLLDQALVHPSFSTTYNNDRLEFMGDTILRLAVTMFLHEHYGDSSVGQLAAFRSHLVSDITLAAIAQSYDLDRFMVMTNSARSDLKAVRSRLADGLEALLAALYLSTDDLSLVRFWLDAHLQNTIQALSAIPAMGNYKVALQELTQGKWKVLPEYQTVATSTGGKGTSNLEIFATEVWVQEQCWGKGEGASIKASQQAAAAVALQAITEYLHQNT
ncbi:ribonuclease III [Tumidithrix elongata RA019]|uniref:Ribonuclease 3 n=1 Tax=Tumidithrix elongata BACA0141 TaxID=2716417 RepID=A0AAW9Q284_9CYAN|nr:ribonuclease III [Tumidithrix elongata RA019]